MNNNPFNVVFLRTSSLFPEDLHQLCVEVNRTYSETAVAVNSRVIGIFPINKPVVTGESWFIGVNQPQQGVANLRQQSFRRVYTFTSTATPIDHGINVSQIDRFTRMFGTFTDGTSWFGIIPSTNVPIAGQLGFYVTPTQIVFTAIAATPKGTIVLEWLAFT